MAVWRSVLGGREKRFGSRKAGGERQRPNEAAVSHLPPLFRQGARAGRSRAQRGPGEHEARSADPCTARGKTSSPRGAGGWVSPLPPEGQARPLVGVGEAHGVACQPPTDSAAAGRLAEADFALLPRRGVAELATRRRQAPAATAAQPQREPAAALLAELGVLPEWMGAGKEVARSAAAEAVSGDDRQVAPGVPGRAGGKGVDRAEVN